ncbi:sugar ABC transporter substrate-binding protein [Rhizobium mongolense]|uniref:sugar ABC transporter substrate-binding protein n=1 Tax=Rhizobium mongolense TaxID=57676 RepID=UPI0034A0EF8F
MSDNGKPVGATGVNRREFLTRTAVVAGGIGLVGATLASPAIVRAQGKKVRVGLGLNYGPFNQPWRRGCYTLLKKVVELGGEPVTVRGTPSKQSEQDSARTLLDRDIDVLVIGIYSLESETAYIVEEAQKRNIKTVGFAVPVKDSPAYMEDTYGTGMALSYYVHNVTGRQGTFVQTAENKGFYTPFDMEADQFELMAKYEPRMKLLPFMPGTVSTQDQISKGRENVLSLLQANPDPGSITGIISWWWPLTIGAGQALQQMGRTDVKIFNHYFSDQLLGEMAAGKMPIDFSTDVPWHIMGEKVAETAIKLGQGEAVLPYHHRVPVTQITKDQASQSLAEVQKMDQEAIAFLKQFGG